MAALAVVLWHVRGRRHRTSSGDRAFASPGGTRLLLRSHGRESRPAWEALDRADLDLQIDTMPLAFLGVVEGSSDVLAVLPDFLRVAARALLDWLGACDRVHPSFEDVPIGAPQAGAELATRYSSRWTISPRLPRLSRSEPTAVCRTSVACDRRQLGAAIRWEPAA